MLHAEHQHTAPEFPVFPETRHRIALNLYGLLPPLINGGVISQTQRQFSKSNGRVESRKSA